MLMNTFSMDFHVLSWYSSLEICAYTSQQNEVTDCKNWHLIETTQTLLLHSHVPQQFWDDVLIACYLWSIACLLSSSTKYLTLFCYLINLSTASLLEQWLYRH